MDNSIYETMKTTYQKSVMDIFVVLEKDIREKYKESGINEFKDYKKLAHKLIAEIVTERYSNN